MDETTDGDLPSPTFPPDGRLASSMGRQRPAPRPAP